MSVTLRGSFCATCGDLFYPDADVCPRCGRPVQSCDFCGKGDVYSYTIVHRPDGNPGGAVDAAPVVVAMVHLAEGAYVTARLDGIAPEIVFIGLPVEAVSAQEPLSFRMRRSFGE